MTQMAYRVAVDLGTTYSAAAVCRNGDPRPEIVPLGGHSPTVASMVFLPADGQMVCGEPARRRAVTDPRRVIREFKRRIGDGTPLVVGGQPVAPETVAARFVSWVLAVVGDREGGPAERVALTHPAEWGPHKREALTAALAEHGVTDVLLLSEPEAAAIGYATTNRVEVGQTVAVYDLGGGTFDAAVVRKLADDRFELVGTPVGIEHLGGVDFDQAVFDHVRDAVGTAWDELDPADPAVQSAVAGLRRECTAAKEALSADTEVMVPVMLPGHHRQVRLGRTEFEEAIRPAVAETVEALRRALDSAGVQRPDAVLMVGGSSRIPLVAQLVSAELGRPVSIDADPKSVIAVGAAVAVRGPVAGAVPAAVPAPTGATTAWAAGEPADAAGMPTVVVPLTGEPECPPIATDPAPRTIAPPRLRRGPILAVATALAVAATVGVGAYTLAASQEPLAAAPGVPVVLPEEAGGQAVAEGGAVDPWTGETATDTSLPGPSRPRAVAAATRPVARVSPTGAAGASAAAGVARTVDTNPPPGVVAPVPNPGTGQTPNPGTPAPNPGPGPGTPAPDPGPGPGTPAPDPGPGPGTPAPDPDPDPGTPAPDPGTPAPDPDPDPGTPAPDPGTPAPDPQPEPPNQAPADPPASGGGTTTTASAPEPTTPEPTTPAVEPTA